MICRGFLLILREFLLLFAQNCTVDDLSSQNLEIMVIVQDPSEISNLNGVLYPGGSYPKAGSYLPDNTVVICVKGLFGNIKIAPFCTPE